MVSLCGVYNTVYLHSQSLWGGGKGKTVVTSGTNIDVDSEVSLKVDGETAKSTSQDNTVHLVSISVYVIISICSR